jgi:hypothetical protein
MPAAESAAMMKLRPKLMEEDKGGFWGGPETWIPVIIVVVFVVLHLADVVAAGWAALVVAVALLYSLGEPIVTRIVRGNRFTGWMRAAALLLPTLALAWGAYSVWRWTEPGELVAEGDVTSKEDERRIPILAVPFDGQHDYWVEVTTEELPPPVEGEEDEPAAYNYRLEVGDATVSGTIGREKIQYRFKGGGPRLEERKRSLHRVRTAIRQDRSIRASYIPAELPAPLHVTVRALPFTRGTLAWVGVPLLLLAAVLEAFERRGKQRSRLTMLVGGLVGAMVVLHVRTSPDNVLVGVLGCAVGGLGGAAAGWLAAGLAGTALKPLVPGSVRRPMSREEEEGGTDDDDEERASRGKRRAEEERGGGKEPSTHAESILKNRPVKRKKRR